jgi:hypothetical protein
MGIVEDRVSSTWGCHRETIFVLVVGGHFEGGKVADQRFAVTN